MSRTECSRDNNTDWITTCDAGDLALIAGVDVQTLRRYEKLGLITRNQPCYSREHLIQIERIVTMELLGFDSSEIKGGLSVKADFREELRIQLNLWKEKKRRLSHLVYFLEQAEQVNRTDDANDWHYVGRVVSALRKVQDREFFRSAYLKRGRPTEETAAARSDSGPFVGG